MPGPCTAVIMAGGSGTRFWPRSRRTDPKQTLPFLQGRSLLQRTVDRLRTFVDVDDMLVVVGRDQVALTRRQLPDLPDYAIVAEPAARNTAPCVGLAALLLARRDPTRPMVVVAADHYIADEAAWADVFRCGATAAAEPGRVVVFGVVPTHAHTGFGYVEFGPVVDAVGGRDVHAVSSFREKPDRSTAESSVAAGTYFWNSGCFAWRPDTVLALVARHMPDLQGVLDDIDGAADFDEALNRRYPQAPAVSVDYGIMEHCSDIVGLTLDVGWNDVGAWPALFDVLPRDGDGNVTFQTDTLTLDCADSLFWGEDQLIAAIGVRDLMVVQSKGVVLVCPRSQGQRVRELVERLQRQGRRDLL